MGTTLIVSLILSVIHSILFFRKDVGISVVLFTIATIIGLYVILDKKKKIKNKKAIILAIPIVLLSSTYFIFNNKLFNVLNIFVILSLFATMIIWMINGSLKFSLLLSKIFNIVFGPLEFVGKALKITKDAIVNNDKGKNNSKAVVIKRIVKAILISIPIVLIVLFLLISADDNFAKLFSWFSDYIVKLFTSIEFLYLILRLALIFILFIYFVSFIYNLTDEYSSFNVIEKVTRKKEIKFDIFTVNTVLTILNIIYLLFSVIQILNLTNSNNIEIYSKSARQGFFQLMILSVINLALVILSKLNKSEQSDKAKRYTKIMNIIMVIFTIILIIVAFRKMYVYQQNYGLTVLRVLVYWGLITESLLIIPTILYILKEKINLFYSYFAIIVVMYVILNLANINKIITKKNIDLYFVKEKIDVEYLEDLESTDVVPELINLMNKIEDENLEVKTEINNCLYNIQKDVKKDRTWQAYNISIKKAKNELNKIDLQYKRKEYKKYNYDKYTYKGI